MALVGGIEIELRLFADRVREGKARRNHQRIVGVARDRVGFGQWRGHLRLVGIGPGHEQYRPCAVLAHDIAVLFGIFGKYRLEPGMDRTLAAIHHDRGIEQLVALFEHDVIVVIELI
jgi:hypothetical protein